ncbi:MAG: DegV family protein [Acholeplasmataceae bacterium]|nr:DegV family protein [Acholeplasmataceae bacterium]
MNKIAIFTDSVADLSEELKEEHEIVSIPHYIRFENEIYLDGVNLSADEYYHQIREKKTVPKITSSRHEDFIRIFERYMEFGYDILYIGAGPEFSLAHQNAQMTKEQIDPARIFVVNSQSISSGIGILVLKAVKMRDAKVSIEEIHQKLTEMVPQVKTQFALRNVNLMIRDKKMTLFSGIFHKMLGIKPIIRIVDGKFELYKKSFGKMKRAINVLIDDLFDSMIYMDTEFIFVTHSLANREAIYVIDRIKKRFPKIEIVESNGNCMMASYCGPRSLGLTYITI